MDSRRTVLKKLLVGGAATAALPSAAVAAVSEVTGLQLADAPAPWFLFAPLGAGTSLAYGWYVDTLSDIRGGAANLVLRHRNGERASVAICARDGAPKGVAHTDLLDLMLMDGRAGSGKTNEALGRVILGVAELIRRNESASDADLRPLARMLTHDERVELFGPDALVG